MKSNLKLTAGFVCVVLTALSLAGSLTPPAAPTTGTMKPLDDVEPRIAIHQTDIPKTISASGSYYLAENVTTPGTGIIINADNVTIDLGGFTMTGPGANYGIYMSNRSNVEIRNGTIQNFSNGITENSTSGGNHRVLGVRVISNAMRGISLSGSNCQVRDCIVSDTGVSAAGALIYGIYVNAGGIVANCTVTGTGNNATATSYIYCIYTNNGSRISNNTVYNNGISAAGSVFGIYAGNATTVAGNTVYDNGTLVTVGNVNGIYALDGCTVTGNTAYGNGALMTVGKVYGISGNSGCTITGNTVFGNGSSSTGSHVYGILIGSGSSVVGNTARGNGVLASGAVYGIHLGGYCLVNNNTAYLNGGTNMYVSVGCALGTNVAP